MSEVVFKASLAGRTVRFLWSSRWRGASTLHTVPKAQIIGRVLKARSPPFGVPEVLCPQQLYSAPCELIFCTRLHCCLMGRTHTTGEVLRSSSCAYLMVAREVLFRHHGIKTYSTYQVRIGWPFARQTIEPLDFMAGSLCVRLEVHSQVQ